MKKIFLTVSLLASVLMIGLASCSSNINDDTGSHIDNSSDDQDTSNNNKDNVNEWHSINDLYFGYGIKKNDLNKFFKTNGKKINDEIHIDDEYYSYSSGNFSITYGINNGTFNITNALTDSELKDVEVTNAFGFSKVIKATVYTEYVTSISVDYYESMDKAQFGASYNGAIIDSNIDILDAQSGNYSYTVSKIGDGYILPSYSDIRVNKLESSYNIDPSVPSICYSLLKSSMTFLNSTFKGINSSYSVATPYNKNDWDNINWDNVQFNSEKVVYDGKPHSIYAMNVPDGVKVSYSDENIINPGEHIIEATFYDPKGYEIGNKTAKLFINDEFEITFKFYYGDNLLNQQIISAHYGDDLVKLASNYVPVGYIVANNDLEWSIIGDQDITVDLMSEYEGYLKITSTNAEINGKYFSYELIDYSYKVNDNQIISMVPYGETSSIEFFLDEIIGIEFCNSLYIYSDFLYKTSKLINLETVDLSNMKYLTEIPDGFFYGCKNLKTIIGHDLKQLTSIGDRFLQNTNIVNFDIDLTNVIKIGKSFLRDAFIGEDSREITIDLPSLQTIGGTKSGQNIDYEGEVNFLYFLYQSKRNDNCIVNLKVYDFLLTNNMFKSYYSVWDNNNLQYYSFINLNVYTNKLSSQERLLTDLPGVVNIYELS